MISWLVGCFVDLNFLVVVLMLYSCHSTEIDQKSGEKTREKTKLTKKSWKTRKLITMMGNPLNETFRWFNGCLHLKGREQ